MKKEILICFLFASFVVIGQTTQPKPLLIYYGFPSKINNAATLQAAAATFSQYRYVVWPDEMENSVVNPTETPKNKQIFDLINPQTTKVFGYISISMKNGSQKLSQSKIRAKIDLIYNFGVRGILFDECGYTDNVSRSRLDSAVRYAHLKQMAVIANTLYPQELYSNAYHPNWNPNNIPTPFTNQDFYLFESHVIINGNYFRFQGENGSQYDEWEFWRAKSDTIRRYAALIGFKVFSNTTPDFYSTYDQQKFHFAWFCAWLNGHEATSWSERDYSSDVVGNTSRNTAVFRTPPNFPNSGNRYLSTFSKEGNNHIRHTNRGKIQANTQTKTFSFGDFDTIISNQSGLWNNENTWVGGKIPTNYTHVIIDTNHTITVPTTYTASSARFKTNTNGKVTTQNGAILRFNLEYD